MTLSYVILICGDLSVEVVLMGQSESFKDARYPFEDDGMNLLKLAIDRLLVTTGVATRTGFVFYAFPILLAGLVGVVRLAA